MSPEPRAWEVKYAPGISKGAAVYVGAGSRVKIGSIENYTDKPTLISENSTAEIGSIIDGTKARKTPKN
jgi:hypothetical protein